MSLVFALLTAVVAVIEMVASEAPACSALDSSCGTQGESVSISLMQQDVSLMYDRIEPGHVEEFAHPQHAVESSSPRKIAIEEHVGYVGAESGGILDEMDSGGINISVLSKKYDGKALETMNESFNLAGMNESQIKDVQIETAIKWNDELYEITKYSQRYRAFANLPMLSPGAAAKELIRCVREYGFVGALINGADTSIAGKVNSYDTKDYDVLWQTFEELDCPLYIHVRPPPNMGPFYEPFYEANPLFKGAPWGFSESTARLVLNLMNQKVFERFSKLKIILGHMGEFLPFWAWRIDHMLPEADRVVERTLKRQFYITTSGFFDTSSLRHLIDVMGVGRVIYATDRPYENVTAARLWFDTAMHTLALNKTEQDMLEFKNAEQLFKI